VSVTLDRLILTKIMHRTITTVFHFISLSTFNRVQGVFYTLNARYILQIPCGCNSTKKDSYQLRYYRITTKRKLSHVHRLSCTWNCFL